MVRYVLISAMVFLTFGCGDPQVPDVIASHNGAISPTATVEREVFHQASLSVRTPLQAGSVRQYLLLGGEVRFLDTRTFDGSELRLHIGFNAPESSTSSAILLQIVAAPHVTPAGMEFVCFAHLVHDSSRHNQELDCGYFSTVTYYIAASHIGRATEHPFHDAPARLPAWKSLVTSPGNDLTGFYVSLFGTLKNAVLGLSGDLFDDRRISVRPVMETIVSRFFAEYQRHGRVSAQALIDIANDVTDHAAPLERLLRFQSIFDRFAHVADVTLEATGGSLTQRGEAVELLTMANEVSRFYLRGSPLSMADFRTRVVRGIRHEARPDHVLVSWEPIAHMYGYAVYIDGEQEAFTRLPQAVLQGIDPSVVTIRAVGYGGEFDGVNYDLDRTSPDVASPNLAHSQ